MKHIAIICLLVTISAAAQDEVRMFLKTEPSGAAVWDTHDGIQPKLLDKKTPAIYAMAKGQHIVLFRMDGYQDEVIIIQAEGEGIIKADTVVLKKGDALVGAAKKIETSAAPATAIEASDCKVDIVFFEDGWNIVLDGNPLQDKGIAVVAPATILLKRGKHLLKLTKDGFSDIIKDLEIGKDTSVDIREKPERLRNRIVLWNEHNSAANNSGTEKYIVTLISNKIPIWKSKELILEWEANKECSSTIYFPSIPFDTARIDILSWHGLCGGLSEVQIFCGEKNCAFGGQINSNGSVCPKRVAKNIIDGITTSQIEKVGYWLAPFGQQSWVEIKCRF